MDHTEEFFVQCNGQGYEYQTGHWYKIEVTAAEPSPERPAGFKYSLAFFDQKDKCLVRYDNSHAVKIHGRPNPVAYDHWHRFSNETLVPYDFKDAATLLEDFFKAIEGYLPP